MPARRRKTKSRNKYFRLFLKATPFLIFVVIGFLVFQGYQYWQGRLWKHNNRFTVVVATSDPKIYSYEPSDQTLTIITIPANLEMDVAMGYGRLMVGSLWQLGHDEGKSGILLKNSVMRNLGIPIDGYVSLMDEGFVASRASSLVPAFFKAIFAFNTNMTLPDRILWVWRMSHIGTGSRREVNLTRSTLLAHTELGDGTDGYIVIPERVVDGLDFLRDQKIFIEGKTIKVLNSSGLSGVGAFSARILSILGLRIISTETGRDLYSGVCEISGSGKNLSSIAVTRIVGLFGCEIYEVETQSVSVEVKFGKGFAELY